MKAVAALLLLTMTASAAEMQVRRDQPYRPGGGPRNTLDVYSSPGRGESPVIFWIHGGGWKKGNKTAVQQKPQAFVDAGCVFVSANYRFVPEVTVGQMLEDLATALAWTREHAAEFGGDADQLVVMGHSAGAHLAALLCTDFRALERAGVPRSSIRACIPVDVSVYDIPHRFEMGGSVPRGTFEEIFGNTPEQHRELSPIAHLKEGEAYPAFLILHVASRPETTEQSNRFAEAIRKAGGRAEVVAGHNKTHGTISTELGRPNDEPTRKVFQFLKDIGVQIGDLPEAS